MNRRKKLFFYQTSTLLLLMLIFNSCREKEDEILRPNISRIEPSSAGPGEYITIVGENFQFATKLIIGGVNITEKPTLEDTFITSIPEITPGIVSIYFEYIKGESNQKNYTILSPRPFISQLSPDTVDVLDTLKISGGYFETNAKVFLENDPLENVTVISDSSILAIIPLDANSGNLHVSSNNRESSSKFVWISNSKIPFINSLLPDSFLVEDTILIKGDNFFDDSLSILFNETEGDNYWIFSEQKLKVIVPEITSSGVLTVKTIYGEDKKTFTLLDKQTLIPIVTEENFTVYIGETIVVEGNNLGGAYNMHLEYNGILIPNPAFSIESNHEIQLFTNLLQESGELVIKNDFGSATITINLKQPPTINEHRPSQNPKDWPLLIIGDDFEDVQEIIFEQNDNKFTLNINDPRIQHNFSQKTIGVKIPELSTGNYDVYLKIKDEVLSNKINFKVIDNVPSGLPGQGSSSVVIPNNPPAASLSSFNNVWSFINTGGTINFDDRSSSNDEFGVILEIKYDTIKTSGTYKKDGSFINITFTDDFGSYEYTGSLDDKYWDDPESESGVFRVILTPVKEGKQIELIFPLGIDSIAPSTTNPQEEFIIYGMQFHVSQDYNVIFTDSNNQIDTVSTESSSIEIKSPTEMVINKTELGIPNGEYNIKIDFNFGQGLSNSLSYEIK